VPLAVVVPLVVLTPELTLPLPPPSRPEPAVIPPDVDPPQFVNARGTAATSGANQTNQLRFVFIGSPVQVGTDEYMRTVEPE
jgi:hypothetical protein